MKIVLLDNSYTIIHEFEDVKAPNAPKKWERRILTYRGKTYTHHDSHNTTKGEHPEGQVETFVEAEVVSLNVTLGGST